MASPPEFYSIPDGYPRLAAFICKDQDWAIFRKFKALNTRNLLYLQNELLDLEAQLQAVDHGLQQNDRHSLRSWWKFSSDQDRLNLVKRIDVQVLSLASPDPDDVQAFKYWMNQDSDPGNTFEAGGQQRDEEALQARQPLLARYDDFLEDRVPQVDMSFSKMNIEDDDATDLATLSKKTESRLDTAIKKNIFISSMSLRDTSKYNYEGKPIFIRYFSNPGLKTTATIFTVILVAAIAVGSIISLYKTSRQTTRLELVGVFTFVMSIILAFCGAKKTEIIVGVIGYAAVLVVFVSTSG